MSNTSDKKHVHCLSLYFRVFNNEDRKFTVLADINQIYFWLINSKL